MVQSLQLPDLTLLRACRRLRTDVLGCALIKIPNEDKSFGRIARNPSTRVACQTKRDFVERQVQSIHLHNT